MFSRLNQETTQQRYYPEAPASRGLSLEPYPESVPVGDPESYQPIQLHRDQFQHRQPREPSPRRTYLRSYTLPSSSQYSSPPIPSDRPPPSLRLPSLQPFSRQTIDSSSAIQSSPSSHTGGVNYRGLSLSLSDTEDDLGYDSPYRQDLIPIVPNVSETSSNFPVRNELSYDPSSGSTSRSASELSPSSRISIETIPSHIERQAGLSHLIHETTHQHHYPASSNRSLDLYSSVPVSYPESSQRTRLQYDQFQLGQPREPSPRRTYLRSHTPPSTFQYSSPPVPSDRPPPSLRLPSLQSLSRQTINSSSAIQSSSSSHAGGVNYSGLSLALSDTEDDLGYDFPNHQDFIPIVPNASETSSNFPARDELSYDSSSGSTPKSASELSPSPRIVIETIPSHIERREGRRRKGPDKMHRCETCFKEFPRPSALKTHMSVHNNARPYACGFPDCPKTFSVRSNARRHYRTHGEKLPPRPSPVPSQVGVQFAELIDVPPQPPPPPLSLSQAPFRVRWAPSNSGARAYPMKHSEQNSKRSGQTDDFDEHEKQSSIILYDPFSAVEPSAQQ